MMTTDEALRLIRDHAAHLEQVRADEWRIFLEVTGYEPEDPTEGDPRTVYTEAVEQIRARALADARVPQIADAYAVAAHQRAVWFRENSAAQAALGRVRDLADALLAGGCHYRHQQGETDECNACTAFSFLRAIDGEGA